VVFRVTGNAFIFFVPMVTSAGLYTGGQIFVAGQTFSGIRFLAGGMAIFAIFHTGVLGVDLTQLPR